MATMEAKNVEFQKYQIHKLVFQRQEKAEILVADKGKNLEVSSMIKTTPDNKNARVELTTVYHGKREELYLELCGYFTLTTKLERNEITDYLGLNGVALLLPYARSIISMVSVLDGKDALLMPTVDVLGLLKSTETFENNQKT